MPSPPTTRRTPRMKRKWNSKRAAFGITGLETALGLAITRLHREKHIPLARIVELFTAAGAVFSISRAWFAGARIDCKTLLFSIRREMDIRSRQVAVKIEKHAVRWLVADGKVVATIVGGRIVHSA